MRERSNINKKVDFAWSELAQKTGVMGNRVRERTSKLIFLVVSRLRRQREGNINKLLDFDVMQLTKKTGVMGDRLRKGSNQQVS